MRTTATDPTPHMAEHQADLRAVNPPSTCLVPKAETVFDKTRGAVKIKQQRQRDEGRERIRREREEVERSEPEN